MGVKWNVGLNTDGKKPPVVHDMYKSTVVTGESMQTRASGTTPHGAPRGPCNQYGEDRIIAGKGKKK